MTLLIAQSAPPLSSWIGSHFGMIAAGVILLAGLIFGAKDLVRLSPRRLWAISSVNFRESIRRKVLWVTVLAMLGVVVVTQLSHPFDAQDAIRQATKYCLFASGIVVVLTMLILACTNLPREIENRVIYTVVTKPTTRLEIVLGKTLGFARTSGLILLIMGLFSYAYLRFNASQLRSAARVQLDNLPAADISRETLQQYVREGLLHAREYGRPVDMQVYAQLPKAGDAFTWMFGHSEQSVLFPYTLPEKVFEAGRQEAQVTFTIELKTDQRALSHRELEEVQEAGAAATQPSKRMPGAPHIQVSILGENMYQLVGYNELFDMNHLAQSRDPQKPKDAEFIKLEPKAGEPGILQAVVALPATAIYEHFTNVLTKDGQRRFYLLITGTTLGTRYGVPKNAVTASLQLYDTSGKPLPPEPLGMRDPAAGRIVTPRPIFRGTLSKNGQLIRGEQDPAQAPVAVYSFQNARFDHGADAADVPFEFRVKIERTSEAGESEDATQVQVVARNARTGFESSPILVTPETDRPAFFRIPWKAVEGGDFDVQIRCRTEGHYVGLRGASLAAVSATRSFGYNLFKSLLILWLLSVLVVVVAIFCSTFVSWPIAVVLTLLILLGRWTITQIGDTASPQAIFTDIFGTNTGAVEARLFTETLRGLNTAVQTAARVLPDTAEFRVTEDIERGINISHEAIVDALKHLGAFGIPLLVLAYLFFKRKEVAP